MNDELRAITKNQRSLDSAVMMSSLMPSEKYSCSGSPLMLVNGKHRDGGPIGQRQARRRCRLDRRTRLPAARIRAGCCARTSPTKRKPLRAMVRISLWSLPLSPTALRAALIRLVRVDSETIRPSQIVVDQIVLADDPVAILHR